MDKWPVKIVELAHVKQRIFELDSDHFFPYALPSVAATNEEIESLEARIGLKLDSGHREFLAAANGWRGFFETQDFLSLNQLQQGEHRDVFTAWLATARPESLPNEYTLETLLPIAVDLEMPLYTAMPIADGKVESTVLFLDAGGIIGEFESFEEYFDGMIIDTTRNLKDFESGKYQS